MSKSVTAVAMFPAHLTSARPYDEKELWIFCIQVTHTSPWSATTPDFEREQLGLYPAKLIILDTS